MAFQGPTFIAARAVFELPFPTTRSPEHDDAFIRAIRNDFPSLVSQQRLPPETPIQVPHIVLQSNASRLAISAAGAELDVRFFGEYSSRHDLCRGYLLRKLNSVVNGWRALEVTPSLLGVVLILNYSGKNDDESAVAHMLAHHLTVDLDPREVQDTQTRVALRLADRYFLNVTLANFETKLLERPVFPGPQALVIKPWEGRLDDYGLQVTLDINNRLTAVTQRADPTVSPQEIEAMIGVFDRTIDRVLPAFIERGRIAIAEMVGQLA